MRNFTKQLISPLSKNAKLDCYVIDNSKEYDEHRKRKAILICPGGAYAFCAAREGEPVALKMLSLGFQAFVLNYSVAPTRFPVSLTELAEAVKYIRENAKDFCIDPNKIIVCGFSAGGHLAGSLGVYWNSKLLTSYGYNAKLIKPNALLLGYAVLTSGKYTHKWSMENLLGEDANNKELLKRLNLVQHIDSNVPPTYLWCTSTDKEVSCENSILFAQQLDKNEVPFRLNIYPIGDHGLSLGSHETEVEDGKMYHRFESGPLYQPEVTGWPEDFCRWTKIIFK